MPSKMSNQTQEPRRWQLVCLVEILVPILFLYCVAANKALMNLPAQYALLMKKVFGLHKA